MHDKYSLGKYASLIFTRLDLPKVPSVDPTAILNWMNAPHRKIMESQVSFFNAIYNGQTYPWRPVWAHDGDQWDKEFATMFPDLVEYVKLFPATEWRRVCLLAQLPNQSVFPHIDPDLGIGWRVYLTTGGPRLFFNKFKNWNPKNENAQEAVNVAEIRSKIYEERFYAPLPEEPHPWTLTSICAAHSVEENIGSADARIVILIMPKLESIDVVAHHELLRRSTEKYASDAIWY
jgi:hypothetical protein